MSALSAVDIIRTKRDGIALTEQQIRWFIDSYTAEDIAHEQASALLMAIVWRGLSPDELRVWTDAMIASGTRLDLSSIPEPTVDKHSTGGVGDKVSLILAPMVAACGIADPMLSGRGLGYTGGTLDKLETIAGFRSDLDSHQMLAVLKDVGCVICAAGDQLVPADRKLYALRDVTGTVESIPLIASSIMSKKIAEGTSALVLDVKVGSGAFLPDINSARELARTMVDLGEANGVRTAALLTAMDTPLGFAAGNALEVTESLAVLNGGGPNDLIEVTVELARAMLELAGIDAEPARTLQDGRALRKFEAMVEAQGGDLSVPIPRAATQKIVSADKAGYLVALDARKIGIAAWKLGAGRARKEDPVSATAGVVCLKKPGDEVARNEPVLELHFDEPARLSPALDVLENAISIGTKPPPGRSVVIERIST